jgi:hypothetical protein
LVPFKEVICKIKDNNNKRKKEKKQKKRGAVLKNRNLPKY